MGFAGIPALSAAGAWAATAGLVFLGTLALAALCAAIGRQTAALARGLALLIHCGELAAVVLYLGILRGAPPPLICQYF
jgi:hypothetical protein